MGPKTPSAVVVGKVNYELEKGVSNEVLGMCGASWLFQTVTNKHTYCARQERVVQVRVVAVEHGLRPPLKIRDMELVVQRTLSRYL